MGKRERLDLLLVERQLVDSREEGRRRILAGEVLVNDQPLTKAGSLVDAGAAIRLKSGSRYVSRGGLKLEKALKEFALDVNGKTVLDVGASTGGFTDCLLAHGAALVFAVDVGYGQLDWKLRNDPRVVVFEKTNIRYLDPSSLPAVPVLATIDASFISLKLVLPRVKELLAPRHEIIALIKPQFEVGKGKVGKGGVVRAPEEHARVIGEIQESAAAIGYETAGVTESPLLGPKGNKEFLIYLRAPA
jgi:23S rRNA (cytidine1920-2'-O)/16S rRNA (cytidine1409-2'-O)-methyltransferase